MKFEATLGCSWCVGLALTRRRAEQDWRRGVVDDKTGAGVLRAGVGPIAEPAAQRKSVRLSETSPGEIWDRPAVKARPLTFVAAAEGGGAIVLPTGASSSTDETMPGGLHVIDGIDVVATVAPEEDVWQFGATQMDSSRISSAGPRSGYDSGG